MTYPGIPRRIRPARKRDATRTYAGLLRVHVEEHIWKAPPMGEIAWAPTTMNRGGRDRNVCDPGRRRSLTLDGRHAVGSERESCGNVSYTLAREEGALTGDSFRR